MNTTRSIIEPTIEKMRHELKARESKSSIARSGAPTASRDSANEHAISDLAKALKAKQKVIYGVDDRVEVRDLTAQADIDDADSVVALFE